MLPLPSGLRRSYFYPRPPRGGRRHDFIFFHAQINFYPRPPRGGRHAVALYKSIGKLISIHALREEGDKLAAHLIPCPENFYPRPPRGGRPIPFEVFSNPLKFLSTPSARRATVSITTTNQSNLFLSTPSARRATHSKNRVCVTGLFLSTPSARRATAKTETKSLFSNKLYNILHEFRRALIYNGSKNYPNHAK